MDDIPSALEYSPLTTFVNRSDMHNAFHQCRHWHVCTSRASTWFVTPSRLSASPRKFERPLQPRHTLSRSVRAFLWQHTWRWMAVPSESWLSDLHHAPQQLPISLLWMPKVLCLSRRVPRAYMHRAVPTSAVRFPTLTSSGAVMPVPMLEIISLEQFHSDAVR